METRDEHKNAPPSLPHRVARTWPNTLSWVAACLSALLLLLLLLVAAYAYFQRTPNRGDIGEAVARVAILFFLYSSSLIVCGVGTVLALLSFRGNKSLAKKALAANLSIAALVAMLTAYLEVRAHLREQELLRSQTPTDRLCNVVVNRPFDRDAALKLVREGADVNGHNGRLLLDIVSQTQASREAITFLIEQGADPDAADEWVGTALHVAIRTKSGDAVRALLASGADPNRPCLPNGFTPLHEAIWEGSLELTRFLIENGADRTVLTSDGESPLELATRRSNGNPTFPLVRLQQLLAQP